MRVITILPLFPHRLGELPYFLTRELHPPLPAKKNLGKETLLGEARTGCGPLGPSAPLIRSPAGRGHTLVHLRRDANPAQLGAQGAGHGRGDA